MYSAYKHYIMIVYEPNEVSVLTECNQQYSEIILQSM